MDKKLNKIFLFYNFLLFGLILSCSQSLRLGEKKVLQEIKNKKIVKYLNAYIFISKAEKQMQILFNSPECGEGECDICVSISNLSIGCRKHDSMLLNENNIFSSNNEKIKMVTNFDQFGEVSDKRIIFKGRAAEYVFFQASGSNHGTINKADTYKYTNTEIKNLRYPQVLCRSNKNGIVCNAEFKAHDKG